MRIELAHLREQATTGQWVDFAVFFAKADEDSDDARDTWLSQLIYAANQAGFRVEAGALVYQQYNQTKYWGHPFVLDYLKKRGIPRPNRYIEF